MTADVNDELAAVAAAITEQLRFYQELGIEDIGGSSLAPQLAFRADSVERSRALESENPPPAVGQTEDTISAASGAPEANQEGLFGDAITSKQMRGSRHTPALLTSIDSQDSSLEAIKEELGVCTRCRLHEHRKTIVFGEGNPHARLVFVGEGPGAEEDATGRPFVGRAGQLLDKIIAAIGLRREDVYIANIVKCRPPGNRTPERDEVQTCEPFLFRQLAFIKPKVIVALGSPAFQCLLSTREPITKARGQWREWNGIRLMPTFHPAFLLRSPEKKREVWEDMKKVRDVLIGE